MQIDLKNCVLFIKLNRDTTDASKYFALKFGDGNFTFNMKENFNYNKDRGRLDEVRRGDEEPLDVSFTGKLESIGAPSGAACPVTLTQALTGYDLGVTAGGPASPNAWALDPTREVEDGNNGLPALNCAPYAVVLELHHNLLLECPGLALTANDAGEQMLFRVFRAESVNHDVKSGQISASGKCNIKAPITRQIIGSAWAYDSVAEAVPVTWAS